MYTERYTSPTIQPATLHIRHVRGRWRNSHANTTAGGTRKRGKSWTCCNWAASGSENVNAYAPTATAIGPNPSRRIPHAANPKLSTKGRRKYPWNAPSGDNPQARNPAYAGSM